MISARDVSVAFGDIEVLTGVTLSVETGEFVGLVGPNGAGKTTLLRTLNGILEPDEGSIAVNGEQLSDCSSKQVSREIGTVPQDTHIGFSFTAEQIVEMGRTPHRSRLDWSDEARPVEKALQRAEVGHLREREITDLSGGERQRVLLARALAQEPSVLVLDEPTGSLDINHQVSVLELVTDLVRDGRAAIAAIHDLELAARFCDRLVLLHEGTIRASGSPATVLSDDKLDEAFDTTTTVSENPVTGAPTVAAIGERPDPDARIHVAGGGEVGRQAIRTLWRAGFDVSVGPVPETDVTAHLADQLGLPLVTAPAFEGPSASDRQEASALAREANAIVLVDGPGQESLRDVYTADESTVPVVRANLGNSAEGARGDGGAVESVQSAGAIVQSVTSLLRRRGRRPESPESLEGKRET